MALLVDLGGTWIRLALGRQGAVEHMAKYPVRQFGRVETAIVNYLQNLPTAAVMPTGAWLGVAGPVVGDHVRLTNIPEFSFSIAGLSRAIGFETVTVLNDAAAAAAAIPDLRISDPEAFRAVGSGEIAEGAPLAIIGLGTGLGLGGLAFGPGGVLAPLSNEGGNVDLPLPTSRDVALAQAADPHDLASFDGFVSAEFFLSGPGLARLYRAACRLEGRDAEAVEPADVMRLAASDTLARTVAHDFLRLLGAYAGNISLIYGATGGVYIAGPVMRAMADLIDSSELRSAFEAKGRYRRYMQSQPLVLTTVTEPGLHGLAQIAKPPY